VPPYNIQNTKHTIYSCTLEVSWCYIQRGFQTDCHDRQPWIVNGSNYWL